MQLKVKVPLQIGLVTNKKTFNRVIQHIEINTKSPLMNWSAGQNCWIEPSY